MFVDALIMDKTWEAPGGFLGFSARFARTGIQMYDGSEIDPDGIVKLDDGTPKFKRGTLYPVERPAEEVFDARSLASFIAKPLTNDHPSEGVTIDNWNAKTKGVVGEVLRDGEYARLSGLMTDKALIRDYRAGKKDLSGGYEANLIIGDGVNAKGEAYVAKQTMIDGNHVAFVDRGRAGSECRVVDTAAHCDALPQSFLDSFKTEKPTMKIKIGDAEVDLSDGAAVALAVGTLNQKLTDTTASLTTATTDLATATTTIATRDAEIVTLKQQVTDAALTPEKLRDAAKAYGQVVGKAKALGVKVGDADSTDAIMKAVVSAKMGDAAKDWNEAQIAASFAVLTKDAKVADADPLATAIVNGVTTTDGINPEADREKRKAALRDGWKQPAATTA
jgi:hypothetical protein